MLSALAPSVKDQAVLLARCAMAASFRCWQTDSRSPTGLCAAQPATRAACSPARSALRDGAALHPGLRGALRYFTSSSSALMGTFSRWEQYDSGDGHKYERSASAPCCSSCLLHTFAQSEPRPANAQPRDVICTWGLRPAGLHLAPGAQRGQCLQHCYGSSRQQHGHSWVWVCATAAQSGASPGL